MQAFVRDLAQMDFHSRIFRNSSSNFAQLRRAATKLAMSPPEPRDFLHDPRAQIGVFLLRHEENRFHARFQFSIHQRHLKFEFEIRNRAQPADDRGRFLLDREIDQQAIERRDLARVRFCRYVARKNSSRSSSEKRGCFWSLCATATITSSNNFRARSITSR